MVPALRSDWDKGAKRFANTIENLVPLQPDDLRVAPAELDQAIQGQAYDFCATTNASTHLSLSQAHQAIKAELAIGIMTEGEALAKLTKRVGAIFTGLSKSHARTIAQTESIRGYHASQEMTAVKTGVVEGWEWLASSDACPLCLSIAQKVNSVRLGERFAEVGNHPTYKDVRFPPAHPRCGCTTVPILLPQYRDPEAPQPKYGETLIQPTDTEAAG